MIKLRTLACCGFLRSSLFGSLPTNWVSLQLELTFAPTQPYQQARLVVYQDDDNYVEFESVCLAFANPEMVMAREAKGLPSILSRTSHP